MAPRSHTLDTGFGKLAKPAEGSRRVSNPRWVGIGLRQSYCLRSISPGGTSGKAHLKIQRLWRRWQQVSWECLERDVAPKEVLIIHCSLTVSRRNGSSCHWIKTSQAEKVGLPLCTSLRHYNFHAQVSFATHHRNTEHKRHHRIRWTTPIYIVVEGDPKAPFSIAYYTKCRGGRDSFPWIAPLYPWSVPYNAEC